MSNKHIEETSLSKMGWRFDNSYQELPLTMYSFLGPQKVCDPKMVILNEQLGSEIGLSFKNISEEVLASFFSGNLVMKSTKYIAQAYAGHQFGYFTILGDGRALLVGEHLTKNNRRYDVQLKGSGKTPYSRSGDGRAAISPVLREYLVSESMHCLGVPTTRSLAAVSTGEKVFRDRPLSGAVLTRVASSHIRIGTFQYAAIQKDLKSVSLLLDYTVKRHFPEIISEKNVALSFLKLVMKKQINLVVNWMRVGFVHGVMNTDNTSISGETIDYGPCAFMDFYDPKTVFSSIDTQGRYCYENQPAILQWNILQLAISILPLIDKNEKKAKELSINIINEFVGDYKVAWLEMMKKKFGFFGSQPEDEGLISSFLVWMQENRSDFTNFFSAISSGPSKGFLKKEGFSGQAFVDLYMGWWKRIEKNKKNINESVAMMKKNNPRIIPRNHLVGQALYQVEKSNNFEDFKSLLLFLKKPYEGKDLPEKFLTPPSPEEEVLETFCGT